MALVYILSTSDYSDSVIVGVYLDRAVAIENAARGGYSCYIAPLGAVVTSETELKVIRNLEGAFSRDVEEFRQQNG